MNWLSGFPNFLRVPSGACSRFFRGVATPTSPISSGLWPKPWYPEKRSFGPQIFAFPMAREWRNEEGEEWESGCLSDDSSFYGPSDRLEYTDLLMPSIKPNQETMISRRSWKNDLQA